MIMENQQTDSKKKIEFICTRCKKQRCESLERFQTNNGVCKYCLDSEKRRRTNIEKYGVPCALQNKNVQEKTKQTSLERYGIDCPAASVEAKEKRKATNLEKFGVEQVFASRAVIEKRKETNLKRYGSTNVLQSEYMKEHRKQVMLAKYGVEHNWQAKEIREKEKRKWLELYGVECPLSADVVRNKAKQTCLKKYGETSFSKTNKFKKTLQVIAKARSQEEKDRIAKKQKAAYMKHFGVDHFAKTSLARLHRKTKYMFNDTPFDSSYELCYYIYQIDQGKSIKRCSKSFLYTFNNVVHSYFPDFEFSDGTLIEIKGDQFLKSDGTWQNPYDHSQDALFEAKHQCALKNNVKILYQADCKEVIDYVVQKYTLDFLKLFRVDTPFPYPNPKLTDTSDYGLIKHFHKSIFEASKKNKLSPLQAWQDKELLREVALNRLKYVKSCRPECILQGLSVMRLAPKISIFRPTFAKRLIDKYLSNCSEIFDPFSGFSGRLIGAANCGKTYIGQDIHSKHVAESNEIIKYKNYQNCTVLQQDILTDVPKSFECLFTCPPYGAKEHWNKDNDEVEKTCDEWIEICLQKYNCKKYLFVIDETEKYKDFIVEKTIKKTGFFAQKPELVILIEKT